MLLPMKRYIIYIYIISYMIDHMRCCLSYDIYLMWCIISDIMWYIIYHMTYHVIWYMIWYITWYMMCYDMIYDISNDDIWYDISNDDIWFIKLNMIYYLICHVIHDICDIWCHVIYDISCVYIYICHVIYDVSYDNIVCHIISHLSYHLSYRGGDNQSPFCYPTVNDNTGIKAQSSSRDKYLIFNTRIKRYKTA